MRVLVAALAALAAACGPVDQEPSPTSPPSVVVGGLSVSDAIVRPPISGQTTGVGYFTLRNTGKGPDRLLSASSPATRSIELHTHRDVGGMKRMERVEVVDASPGEAVVFRPGGLHLMMFGFAAGGETMPVTLTFENAGEVVVPFKIVARSAGQGETGHGIREEHAH